MGLRVRRVKRAFGFDKTQTEKYVIVPDRATIVSFGDLCEQVALADGRSFLEVDGDDLSRGFEREIHLLVGEQVGHSGDTVRKVLRAYDEPVDVQGVYLTRRNDLLHVGSGGAFATVEVVVDAQGDAEDQQNEGRDDPFFLFHAAVGEG